MPAVHDLNLWWAGISFKSNATARRALWLRLAKMLSAGVPILKALKELKFRREKMKGADDPTVIALGDIAKQIEAGRTFGDADAASETSGRLNSGSTPRGSVAIIGRRGINVPFSVFFHGDGRVGTEPHTGIADGAFPGIHFRHRVCRRILPFEKKSLYLLGDGMRLTQGFRYDLGKTAGPCHKNTASI